MTRWSMGRLLGSIALGAALWAAIAAACLCVGSTGIRWPRGLDLLDRLDRVLLASLVGAALAAAGVVYQAILRNPLADPYLLGVSTGASLAAFVWRIPGSVAVLGAAAMAMSQQSSAFIGALISVSIVLALASRRGRLDPIAMLLVGVIVNAVNASVFLLLNEMMRDLTSATGGNLVFLIGGIQTNLTGQQVQAAAAAIAVGWAVLLYLSGSLTIAGLGQAEAESLGLRIHRLRWVAMIVASLVTAAAVAVSGPIGFVGLICPHIARRMVGADTRRVLPLATALGAALLAAADSLSRLLSAQSLTGTVLPVGVLTGLLGGPFFLMLLLQSRRSAGAPGAGAETISSPRAV